MRIFKSLWIKIKYKIIFSKPYTKLLKLFKPNLLTTYILTPLTDGDILIPTEEEIIDKFCAIPLVNPIGVEDLKKILERSNNE